MTLPFAENETRRERGAPRHILNAAVALVAVQVLSACVASGGNPTGVLSDEPSVDSDGLRLAAMQAVEACGKGSVESVRVVTVRRPNGDSTPEAGFVCRDRVTAMVRRHAVETCGAENVQGTSVAYHESSAVESIGFRCREEPR